MPISCSERCLVDGGSVCYRSAELEVEAAKVSGETSLGESRQASGLWQLSHNRNEGPQEQKLQNLSCYAKLLNC